MARTQLLTVLAYLMVVTLAHRVQPVHRERRQSFDSTTSATTNDDHSSYPSDTPADLSLTPLPTSDTITENEDGNVNKGFIFHFDDADTDWEAADISPTAEVGGVDPEHFEDFGFTDDENGNDDSNNSNTDIWDSLYPTDDNNTESNVTPLYPESDTVDQECLSACQLYGTAVGVAGCESYSCDTDTGDLQCLSACQFYGTALGVPGCESYSCDGNLPVPESCLENTSLRPMKERACSKRSECCIHGICPDPDGFICKCDDGWIGLICNVPCTLNCTELGSCWVNQTKAVSEITEKDMRCTCDHKLIGDRCQYPKPDKVAEAEERGDKIAIILSVSLVGVLIISTILLVILWRRRFIPIMNVIYFFKMAEDDDGKLYDAYISASKTGNAMTFVNETLAPKLESLGFRLYIPSRDLLAGEVISDDIVEGIKQSRRTIMVVTPEYSMNAWSRFEVLNAQTETINLKHRMIPIILEDVSQEIPKMQKSLKHILESMKCLKVPGYKSCHHLPDTQKKMIKFWNRLELTMPKTKTRNSNSNRDINTLNRNELQEPKDLEKDLSGMLNNNLKTNQLSDCQSMSQHSTTSKYQMPSIKYQDMPVDQSRSMFPNIAVHQNAQDFDIDAAKFKKCYAFNVKL